MKLDLHDILSTPQDLKALIIDIKKYKKWFSAHEIKKQVSGLSNEEAVLVSPNAGELIKQLAAENALNIKNLEDLLKSLETLLNSAPRVVVTLAGVPPTSLKKEMLAWFRKNIGPTVLVDYRFNATLLGGMVVQYGSRVFDWSFRRQILAARGKFPEVLRRV